MDFPLLPFALFALAGSITPGPNNIMLAAGGANNGVRATVPHMVGIAGGFAVMIMAVGLGLAAPLAAFPGALHWMRWVGVVWIGWIAWQVATSPPPGEGAAKPPMGLMAAALFQWINPKAWLLALGVITVWANPAAPLVPQYAAMAAIFGLVTLPSCVVWVVLGEQAGRLLRRDWQVRVFNIAMAALLLGSIVPILAEP